MSEKNIIEIGYFNVNSKENSILKNAKHQDNEISNSLNEMAKLGEKLKNNISAKNTKNNVDTSINFRKNKQ
mgnify:FL=1